MNEAGSYLIGDAFKLLQLEKRHIDAIVTDPPFKMDFSDSLTGLRKPFYAEIRKMGTFKDFDILKYLPLFEEICDPLVLFCFMAKNSLPAVLTWAEERGYSWELLEWHKRNPIPFTGGHFMSDTEFIFHARAKGAFFSDSLDWSRLRTYYVMDSPRRKFGRGEKIGPIPHPCTKPLSILENLVQIACPPGGTILDPFAGSGTTLRAALKHGINAIGYEINPEWEPLIQKSINLRDVTLFDEERYSMTKEEVGVPFDAETTKSESQHDGIKD